MNCPSCGRRVSLGAASCGICGTPVFASSPVAVATAGSVAVAEMSEPTALVPAMLAGSTRGLAYANLCVRCDTELEPEARFCSFCGTTVEPGPDPLDATKAFGSPLEPEPDEPAS